MSLIKVQGKRGQKWRRKRTTVKTQARKKQKTTTKNKKTSPVRREKNMPWEQETQSGSGREGVC